MTLARLSRTLREAHDIRVSEAAMPNMLRQEAKRRVPASKLVDRQIAWKELVENADETGFRVEGETDRPRANAPRRRGAEAFRIGGSRKRLLPAWRALWRATTSRRNPVTGISGTPGAERTSCAARKP